MVWLLVFSLISSQVFAQTVLVDGNASELDYRAELKAHPDLISPVEAYQATHPAQAEREALIMAFADAQKKFLEKDSPEAMDGFKRVLDFLPHEDWAESDREIFLQAYLRLGQLATTPAETDRWLRESLSLGLETHFDAALYPPPLVTRRQQLFASAKKFLPSETLLSHDYQTLLIAGRPCSRRNCLPTVETPGRVRVTWLSNRLVPESQIMNFEELKTPRLSNRPFAQGECGEPRWAFEASNFAQKRLFTKPCVQAPKLVPSFVAANRPEPRAEQVSSPAPEEHTPIYKNKWVWIGAGVLAAGAVAIALASRPHETKDPSVSYGYR